MGQMKYKLESEEAAQAHEKHATNYQESLIKKDLVEKFGTHKNITPEGINKFAQVAAREQVEIAELLAVKPVQILFADLPNAGQAGYNRKGGNIYLDNEETEYLLQMFSRPGASGTNPMLAEFNLMSHISHEYYHHRQYLRFPKTLDKEFASLPYEARRHEHASRLFSYLYLKSRLDGETDAALRKMLNDLMNEKSAEIKEVERSRAVYNRRKKMSIQSLIPQP